MLPRLDSEVKHFKMLKRLMEESSSTMGYIISLGESFIKDSHEEMDKSILPKLKEILGGKVPPRVQTCYGMLMWFVLKVTYCSYICNETFKGENNIIE